MNTELMKVTVMFAIFKVEGNITILDNLLLYNHHAIFCLGFKLPLDYFFICSDFELVIMLLFF